MAPRLRKLILTVHLTVSIGWIGAAFVYLALGLSAVLSDQAQAARAAWIAMEITGWFVIVPLAVFALLSGILLSLSTRWGLVRHYWVLITLVLTSIATGVTLLHMPDVSAMADRARTADKAGLAELGGDLFHPGIGLLILLVITVLNVYKPRGVTRFGRTAGPQR
jgi:hypothetical protein